VRLWLRDPENAWETPEGVRERWARVYDDVRPERAIFPLEPVVRSEGNKGGGAKVRGEEMPVVGGGEREENGVAVG
jgi:hypothetical protein